MKRLFIESEDLDSGEYHRAQRAVYEIHDGKDLPDKIFDEILDNAAFRMAETWEAIKRTDEIYAYSSLISLSGYGSYNGAPLIFNTMMKSAVAENIRGKRLIFLNELKNLEWDNIDLELLAKVFVGNQMFSVEQGVLTPIDIPTLIASI